MRYQTRADIQRESVHGNREIAAGGKSHTIHFTLLAHSPLAHGAKHDYLRLQVENLRGRMENVVLTIHLLLALGLVGIVLLQRSEGGVPDLNVDELLPPSSDGTAPLLPSAD